MTKKIVFLLIGLFLLTAVAEAQQTKRQAKKAAKLSAKAQNAQRARAIFDEAYDKVFGEQGSSLTYNVNIIGLYKTAGNIVFKGKKSHFTDSKVDSYNDGVTAYMCYRKKKVVEIHNANSDKKDKHSGKFKFELSDFDYSMESEDGLTMIKLKQRKSAKGTIKEVKAYLNPNTLDPVKLRIKVAFFWTTVKISNFKSGGISDAVFKFPREKYRDYEFEDKR